MKYFICSDIHSYYDEFINALNESGYDKYNSNHKLIILGDYFDRGTKACSMRNFILDNNNVIYVRGNHDNRLLRIRDTKVFSNNDIYNGTAETVRILSGLIFDNINEDEKRIISKFIKDNKNILNKIENMPYYKVIGDTLFIHGWWPKSGLKGSEKEWYRAAQCGSKKIVDEMIEGIPINPLPNNINNIVIGHYKATDFIGEIPKNNGVNLDLTRKIKVQGKTIYAIDGCTNKTGRVPILIMEI